MAEPAGSLVSTVLRRIRDPQASATSYDLARAILSDCQRLVNAGLNRVVTTGTLTTEPFRLFYPLDGLFDPVTVPPIRVLSVTEGNRDLTETTVKALNQYDLKWFRHLADRFEAWAPVGRSMIVIFPAKRETSSVVITYTKATNDLVNDAEVTELPDRDLADALDLTEIILSARLRDFKTIKSVIDRVTARAQNRASIVEV